MRASAQATSALVTCWRSHLSCPHSESNRRLTWDNLVPTNGLIVLLGYCALNNVSWLYGWVSYVRRASLVLVMLTGFILYYVPEMRKPARRGCHFTIDLIAYGMKNIIGGIEDFDNKAKPRDSDSVSLNSNATEQFLPINFSNEMKCSSIFEEQKNHDNSSIFPDNTSQRQRQESCRRNPLQLYGCRIERSERFHSKMHQSSNNKFKEKSSAEIIPTLPMPLMQSGTFEHQEISIFSRTHCDQCTSRQEDLIGDDGNEGSRGKANSRITYGKNIENSCHSSEIELLEWNENDFGGNKDVDDPHNGYRKSTATSCSHVGSINSSKLYQPLESQGSVSIVREDLELVLEKTEQVDRTEQSVVPMEQRGNNVISGIQGQKSSNESLIENKKSCSESRNCCEMETDLQTTDDDSNARRKCYKASGPKTGYLASFLQSFRWIFGTYPTARDSQVSREKKISTFVKANLKDFI